MFLKRVCMFLAAAFLVVNIVLFAVCIRTRDSLTTLPDGMIANAVAYFASCGVTVEPTVIPEHIPDNAVYTFEKDNAALASEITEKLAAAYFPDSSVSFIETPDGITYAINQAGSPAAGLRVFNDAFTFEYSLNAFDRDSLPFGFDEPFTNENTRLTDSQRRAAEKLLNCLTAAKNGKEYTVRGILPLTDGVYVCLSQNIYDGYEVGGMFVNLFLKEDGVVYAYGNRVFAGFVKSYCLELTDGVNALHMLDLSGVQTVRSERIAYIHRFTGSGTHYLIPVWEITYVDTNGDTKTQHIDAIKK
ncbi:MAG: hypothetical protein ACI4RV_02295 [Eubacteriales bacterium]